MFIIFVLLLLLSYLRYNQSSNSNKSRNNTKPSHLAASSSAAILTNFDSIRKAFWIILYSFKRIIAQTILPFGAICHQFSCHVVHALSLHIEDAFSDNQAAFVGQTVWETRKLILMLFHCHVPTSIIHASSDRGQVAIYLILRQLFFTFWTEQLL